MLALVSHTLNYKYKNYGQITTPNIQVFCEYYQKIPESIA